MLRSEDPIARGPAIAANPRWPTGRDEDARKTQSGHNGMPPLRQRMLPPQQIDRDGGHD